MIRCLREFTIPVMVILALVFSGCCCPKKSALPTTTVASAPEVKEEAPPAPESIGTESLESQAKAVGALQIVYFDFDKSNLNPTEKEKLDKTSAWLSDNPEANLRIEGHCDERGTSEYNLALGERRANSAKKYLINLGNDPQKISTISYGEENPADPAHNKDAWSKNRRDEFKIIGD